MLDGWSREPCEGGTIFHAPTGAVRTRVRPRVRPLVRPRAILEEIAGAIAGDVTVAELATPEGESALVADACVAGGGPARRCAVAMVGDEPFLCIDAIGPAGTPRAIVTELAGQLGLGLGAGRRRWFRYAPPPGWLGFRRRGATLWLPADLPRSTARIAVFDARRFVDTPAERLDHELFLRLAERFSAEVELPPSDVVSAHGLEGRLRVATGTTHAGRRVLRAAAALADDAFAYLAHLEGEIEGDHFAGFCRMLESFRPVSRAGVAERAAMWWEED